MTAEGDDPVADLAGKVELLRAELASIRRALEAEVRTRRVVVVDDLGVERIVLGAGDGHASVVVRSRGGPVDALAELYAVDRIDVDGPEVGVALVVDGDVVGGQHVLADVEPSPDAG